MRRDVGITLIALIITIVVMLILAGVTISTFTGEGSIIENAETAVEGYNNKVINEQETLNEVIEYIKNDGNVNIDNNGISISATADTTGVTKEVIVTVVGKAEDGIKSFTSTAGDNKTYASGTKKIIETCEITENGIYLFTIEDINGKTASRGILIENILEGTIQIKADKTTPTKENVKVTVVWPSGSDKGVQEIKVGNNSWQSASGNTSQVEVTENCTVTARVRNSTGEVMSSSITISNIDKFPPIVTATSGTETIEEGTSNDISNYFTYSKNGTAKITGVIYTDTSDGNKQVTNTNTLSVGTHVIKCTVTKETGLESSATKTIVVETGDTTPPYLVIECVTSDSLNSDSVVKIKSVEDDVAMPENPVYSYYLKKATASDSEYELKYKGTNTSYNPTNDLEQYASYIMKVEVADAAGNIGSAVITVYGPACFVEGTQVLTEFGMKNIEEIKVGEKVYAINIDTNKRELKEVKNVIESESTEIYELTIGEEIVKATPKHKFYIVDKGWVMACELEEGDIISAKDNNITIDKIKLVNYNEPIKVYNLTVDDFHTYLITEYELLVHNLASLGGPGSSWDSEGNFENGGVESGEVVVVP